MDQNTTEASYKKKKKQNLKFKIEENNVGIDVKINEMKNSLYDIQLSDLKCIGFLGQGCGGKVDKMQHIQTGDIVAMKSILVSNDEIFKKSLKQELDILQQCDCKYIVKCYNTFYQNGVIKVLLEYMDMGNLASIYRTIGKIPEVIIGVIAVQCLQGLYYLHKKKKVIHRDIKPQNLLVNSKGEVKIADFGVSGQLESTLAPKNTFVGTTIYMSPERLKGDPYTSDTDLWSLGLTLLECAMGKYPIEYIAGGKKNLTFWDVYEIVKDRTIFVPDEFSAEFKDFILTCVNKDNVSRPTCEKLFKHPFIEQHAKIDLEMFKTWLQFVYENKEVNEQ